LPGARAIQRSLLPSSWHAVAGYKTAIRSISSYEVGGDYLDSLQAPSGEQIMIVADVAGKGLTSAMIAKFIPGGFRAMIMARVYACRSRPAVERVVLCGRPEARSRYVTAILFRLDQKPTHWKVVNAVPIQPCYGLHRRTVRALLGSQRETPIVFMPSLSMRAKNMTSRREPGCLPTQTADGGVQG